MSDKLVKSGAARWGLLVSLVAVFALLSGLCLPGCSDNPAASSQTAVTDDGTSFFDLPYDEVELSKRIDDPATDVEILFGEELFTSLDGGTMTIGTAGNSHELIVYPLAVTTDVTITVEITKIDSRTSDEVAVIYEFGPDGLSFTVPAILRINVARVLGKKATSVSFYYLDESVDTPNWLVQGTYYADEFGYAEIPVYHFSKYGID